MTDFELAARFSLAARKLLRAAKNLSSQLPDVSGNHKICDARRCIEHYDSRLDELEEEMDKSESHGDGDGWPPLPGGR